MSIYHFTFSNMLPTRPVFMSTDLNGRLRHDYVEIDKHVVNEFSCLQEALKNSDHTFVFIITKKQWESWRKTCKEYGYDDYTLFEMPYFVMNYRYQPPAYTEENGSGGRKLRLVILKGKGKHED